MYDLNLAVDQLQRKLNSRFPNVGTETRKSQGTVPADAIEMITSAVERVLISLAEVSRVRRVRLEDGFSAIGEGVSAAKGSSAASFAYLQADIQFQEEISGALLPFAQQGTAPVRSLSNMAERNGGYLLVESKMPDILRFTVKLPIAAEDSVATAAVSSATILLVEDEEFVRNVTQEVLEMEGFRVLAAANGREALELVRKNEIDLDLLLTDVVLPGMNGRDLAKQMADAMPALKVMFMSGYTDNRVRSDLAESTTMYLQKPFTLDTLTAKVREALVADSVCPQVAAEVLQRAATAGAVELR